MRPVLLGVLTALLTLTGVVDAASATPYDFRGEWSVEAVCKACTFPGIDKSKINGTALITTESAGGAYSGSALLESISGSMSGTVTGTTQVSAHLEAGTPDGNLVFNVPDGTLNPAQNTFTGEGTWQFPPNSGEAVVSGHRLRTIAEVEKEEKILKEKREKEEQEGKEKREKEEAEATKRAKEAEEAKTKEAEAAKAKEDAEQEAQAKQREKEAQEQKSRAERVAKETEYEAKARAEYEAKEREAQQPSGPATLVGKTLALGGSGSLSLQLSNPNGSSVSGEVVLLAASGHASKKGKGAATVLGKGSFTLSSHGTVTVKLKLSHSTLAEFAHHHTLQATARVTTRVTGKAPLVATYAVTVHGSTGKHH
jgi:flagellar motor protein MotB